MSLEFELPLFSLIFITILCGIYFLKKRVKIEENKVYEVILICSFLEIVIDTIIHLICALTPFDILVLQFFPLFNFLNKVLTMLFIIIFSCLLCYTLMITYEKLKKDKIKVIKTLSILNILFAIILLFTNIELIEVGNVTNVKGTTITIGYSIVALLLGLSLIISVKNIKKLDKRYLPIFAVFITLSVLYVFTLIFPGMIIYDVILALMCYIMYFTIENPDLKMLKQMETAKGLAEKANRAKSDFLSSMSHEIRTPLNAIVGLSEDNMNYKDQIPKEVLENSEDIIHASQTLLEIVGNILDINKIESQKMELIMEVYHPKETIEQLAKIDATRIGDKPINFKMHIAEDLPYELIGDRTHVKQVLNNLLSNAFKYTEKGEVILTVKCINQDNLSNMIISVQDTGRGIKVEDIDKLFTKFERLDVERNTTVEGTGLGLAITKQLVEMMGGKINVESRYGEGFLFIVNIPQKISKMANPLTDTQVIRLEEVRKEELKNADYGSKKVLIVDDNKLNIKVARRALQDFNFEIDECYDGVECLGKVVNGNEYDLILMDIMMPNMSGETAISKLKENPNFKIPTIALTADAVAGAREKYISEGFIDYIAKPFNKDQIKEKLDVIFSREQSASVGTTSRFQELPKEFYKIGNTVDVQEIINKQVENNIQEEKLGIEEQITSPTEYLKQNKIDVEIGISLLGDFDMYQETLQDFYHNLDSKIERLNQFLRNSDMPNYAIEVHALKSDSKYLGLTKLADISLQQELKSKENDILYVREHYKELLSEVDCVKQIIKVYLEKYR